jgi:hypothetical protein
MGASVGVAVAVGDGLIVGVSVGGIGVADTKGLGVSVALAEAVGLPGAGGVAVACWFAMGVAVGELSQAASATLTKSASMSTQTYRMLTDLLLLPSSAPLFLLLVTVPGITFPPQALLNVLILLLTEGSGKKLHKKRGMPA